MHAPANPVDLVLMAILQGLTELFPVSSLGHSVLVPAVLHWNIDRQALWFLPFLVVLHLGTAAALLLYFRREWIALIGGGLRQLAGRGSSPEAHRLWLLVVGTIPAGLVGLILEHPLRRLFGDARLVAVALAANGLVLLLGDWLHRRRGGDGSARLDFVRAAWVGLAQTAALIPGFSRSGTTLVAGLGAGLSYADAAEFSFLLGTPIIGAAGLLEVPKLFHDSLITGGQIGWIVACGLLAGFFAYVSTAFLMRYFRGHEIQALRPFAAYCVLAGIGALALLATVA
ncbi:MAG TPA: undecaprenyl-diphosphate phosphatase [Gammaproteobacteria bacterium]|nr:undecaprenyl-diphosphate phosphatase [Gammaproteobacteria bacterium]